MTHIIVYPVEMLAVVQIATMVWARGRASGNPLKIPGLAILGIDHGRSRPGMLDQSPYLARPVEHSPLESKGCRFLLFHARCNSAGNFASNQRPPPGAHPPVRIATAIETHAGLKHPWLGVEANIEVHISCQSLPACIPHFHEFLTLRSLASSITFSTKPGLVFSFIFALPFPVLEPRSFFSNRPCGLTFFFPFTR
jgi:hypothetical protein